MSSSTTTKAGEEKKESFKEAMQQLAAFPEVCRREMMMICMGVEGGVSSCFLAIVRSDDTSFDTPHITTIRHAGYN